MNYPGRIVKKGEPDSSLVSDVQKQINKKGFGPLAVDGDFGALTESAVKEFQSLSRDSNGIPLMTDGQIGPISWAVLFDVSVGIPAPAYNQPRIFTRVLEIAFSQLGVMEVPPGSNRGPEVEKYLESVGCAPGDPWCASFVYWCFNDDAVTEGLKNPLTKTGSCMIHWDKTNGK